jgi:hypothetical protein
VQRDVYVASFGELARLLVAPGTAAGAAQPGVPGTHVPGDIFTFIDSEVKAHRVKHEEAGWMLPRKVKDMPAEPSILIGFNALKKKGPFDFLIGGLPGSITPTFATHPAARQPQAPAVSSRSPPPRRPAPCGALRRGFQVVGPHEPLNPFEQIRCSRLALNFHSRRCRPQVIPQRGQLYSMLSVRADAMRTGSRGHTGTC